jgi:hypothetical protein
MTQALDKRCASCLFWRIGLMGECRYPMPAGITPPAGVDFPPKGPDDYCSHHVRRSDLDGRSENS